MTAQSFLVLFFFPPPRTATLMFPLGRFQRLNGRLLLTAAGFSLCVCFFCRLIHFAETVGEEKSEYVLNRDKQMKGC